MWSPEGSEDRVIIVLRCEMQLQGCNTISYASNTCCALQHDFVCVQTRFTSLQHDFVRVQTRFAPCNTISYMSKHCFPKTN